VSRNEINRLLNTSLNSVFGEQITISPCHGPAYQHCGVFKKSFVRRPDFIGHVYSIKTSAKLETGDQVVHNDSQYRVHAPKSGVAGLYEYELHLISCLNEAIAAW
jgi:hypothetical protein